MSGTYRQHSLKGRALYGVSCAITCTCTIQIQLEKKAFVESFISESCSPNHDKASSQYTSFAREIPKPPLGKSPKTSFFSIAGIAASKDRYTFGRITKKATKGPEHDLFRTRHSRCRDKF